LARSHASSKIDRRQAEARGDIKNGRTHDQTPTHHRQQSAVVLQASKRGAPKGSWLEQMLARKPRMLVTVALANKTARIIWALL
jgi:transposase